ncbi:hypothetical protein RvY_11718 [Ramazzottius varieornatus]|uniref:Reverse transcriptase domain-containing protein n=1 Tax=Ramazzottius varieornatus TaxID=947166 RepID=A0A1D1VJF9_RAMVA|nr:hypothetical protein RvY_11718 [Ramazzottius varieornatus]
MDDEVPAASPVTVQEAHSLVQNKLATEQEAGLREHSTQLVFSSAETTQNVRFCWKLDFKNAFDFVFRSRLPAEVKKALPLYFTSPARCTTNPPPSSTAIKFWSPVGDHLRPLFFCLVTKELSKSMKSDFNCWYLDDATIGRAIDQVIEDFQRVAEQYAVLGLELNMNKSTISVVGGSKKDQLTTRLLAKAMFPTITPPSNVDLLLLGASVLPEAIRAVFQEKTPSRADGIKITKIRCPSGFVFVGELSVYTKVVIRFAM